VLVPRGGALTEKVREKRFFSFSIVVLLQYLRDMILKAMVYQNRLGTNVKKTQQKGDGVPLCTHRERQGRSGRFLITATVILRITVIGRKGVGRETSRK
jgi:hypothetical protein